VLFLNNDYKGGELCFKNTFDNEEFCIKPTPGMLVVWPSNLLFPHAVKPITEGTRYTIVSWAR
jgi:predicted 2-oxoglutarate/Fe(II)-dependent dioxygenase YbiX